MYAEVELIARKTGARIPRSVEFFSTIRNKSVNALKIEDRINNGKNAFVRVATFR